MDNFKFLFEDKKPIKRVNTKYNRFNVYNNAVKNTKLYTLTFNDYEIKCISNMLNFNSLYSKMYKHIAQNLIYNFKLSLSPITLNSYQLDGFKDCIENYIKKVKTTDKEIKTLENIKKNLIKLIKNG